VVAVLRSLEEIGAPYDFTEIRVRSAGLRSTCAPALGRFPALQLGDGATMFKSAAICLHLEAAEG
jgi:glutathione S-transferase